MLANFWCHSIPVWKYETTQILIKSIRTSEKSEDHSFRGRIYTKTTKKRWNMDSSLFSGRKSSLFRPFLGSSPWPFTVAPHPPSTSSIIQHPGRQRPWPLPWRCWMGRWKGRRWGRCWSRWNAWERGGRKMHDAMMIHDAIMRLCLFLLGKFGRGIAILYC